MYFAVWLGLRQARGLSDTTDILEHGIYTGACVTSQGDTTKVTGFLLENNNIRPVNTGMLHEGRVQQTDIYMYNVSLIHGN